MASGSSLAFQRLCVVTLDSRDDPAQSASRVFTSGCSYGRGYGPAPLRAFFVSQFPAPHQALALMWCCSSFGVEWVGVREGTGGVPETVVGRLDYSQRPSVSFACPERARAAVRIATRRPEFPAFGGITGAVPVIPPRVPGAFEFCCMGETAADASHTIDFEETDASRTRPQPFLPGVLEADPAPEGG
eukprot:gene10807-biopygen18337